MSNDTPQNDKRQRLPYTKLSPAGIVPMRALEHYLNAESGLEAVLLELVRLRVSRMNGCAFCVGLHTHELRRHNEPQGRIDGVAGWAGSDAYTQRERAALRWAEVLTHIQGEVPEHEFAAVREHFTEREMVDLSLAIASINAWNRLGVAFLPQWDESRAGGGRAGRPDNTASARQNVSHDGDARESSPQNLRGSQATTTSADDDTALPADEAQA